MATDTVTNNSDDNTMVGSLRYELAHANAGDTINFAPGVTSIALTGGSLEIATNNLKIEGSQPNSIGTPGVTIDGGNQTTDLVVNPGVNATIDGLVIQNGRSSPPSLFGSIPAGGILDDGTLTLSHSALAYNVGSGQVFPMPPATKQGGYAGGTAAGAIYVANGATLNLVGNTNTFTGNKATGGSGGFGGEGSAYDQYGNNGLGGAGGIGAYAADGKAKTLAAPGSSGSGAYAGGGGAAGQAGMPGQSNGMGMYGGGGGGGGGDAFADYGGPGTVNIVPVCFVSGTLIRTARGDVAVEDLAIGDLAVTSSGEHRPIRWLGHRTIDCRKHPDRQSVMPIRVAAHAFGPATPSRDLFLSPGHPVLVGADEDGSGGHLVPIMCLINGTTIDRVEVDHVTYWHIELDEHDILLAEGLPAESYIDLGSRLWFAGADGALYDPDMAPPGTPDRCRPVAIDGPLVEAERRRLDAVFAMRLEAACAWPTAATDRLLWQGA